MRKQHIFIPVVLVVLVSGVSAQVEPEIKMDSGVVRELIKKWEAQATQILAKPSAKSFESDIQRLVSATPFGSEAINPIWKNDGIEELIKALDHENCVVGLSAAKLLLDTNRLSRGFDFRPLVRKLIGFLNSKSIIARQLALESLVGNFGRDASVVEALKSLVADEAQSPVIRHRGIQCLETKDQNEAAVPILLQDLKSTDPSIRIGALELLLRAECPPDRVLSELEKMLDDPEPAVQYRSVGVIGSVGETKELRNVCVCVLRSVLKSGKPSSVKVNALKILRPWGLSATVATREVLDLLNADSKELRFAAVESLVRISSDNQTIDEALIERLEKDDEVEVRRSSAYLLTQCGRDSGGYRRTINPERPDTAAAVAALLRAAREDRDSSVRASAIYAIGMLRPPTTDLLRSLTEIENRERDNGAKSVAARSIESIRAALRKNDDKKREP